MIAALFIEACLLAVYAELFKSQIREDSLARKVYGTGLGIFLCQFAVTVTYLLWKYLP